MEIPYVYFFLFMNKPLLCGKIMIKILNSEECRIGWQGWYQKEGDNIECKRKTHILHVYRVYIHVHVGL